MSGEPNRLKAEGQALRQLASDVEQLFDGPTRSYHRLAAGGGFAGPFARRTETELADSRGRLRTLADRLRAEADSRDAQARHLESTDSAWEDVTDFVTGRDFTPWS